MLHRFSHLCHLSDSVLNCPFYYTPDAISIEAADAVRALIAERAEWREEVDSGKMFGALVVRDEQGELGFLAAYSGQIAGRSDWEGFVPAVFDYLQPDGYFAVHEREISGINHRIDNMLSDKEYLHDVELLHRRDERDASETADFQQRMRTAKLRRDERRATATDAEREEMIRESQWMKAELKRIRRRQQAERESLAARVVQIEQEVELLKKQRQQQSDNLQRWLFTHFVMLNGRGEKRTLLDIFADSGIIPPSGAGECCAPKLLQYAFLHDLQPLRIVEFWQGASPIGEIRHHDHYYPACRSKCLPILRYMLQGIDVQPNPLEEQTSMQLETIYEDDSIVVVNKPSGMLSVPGKSARESVYTILRRRYPAADGPMIVHRLDMATSGLMVVALSEWAYHALQRQFQQREVHKRYVATLERDISGEVPSQGVIRLPLRADPMDRPRQVVDEEHGKVAETSYELLGVDGDGHTVVALTPHTGRTHQLRVHCAHQKGLNCPILGDALYGRPADRLHLHAQSLTFVHPKTKQPFHISTP